MKIFVFALLEGAGLAFAVSLLCYFAAIRRERKGPAQAGRALVVAAALLLVAALTILASIYGRPPPASMADFLIALTLVQTLVLLVLDVNQKLGALTLGNSVASIVNLAAAQSILSVESSVRPAALAADLHVVIFLGGFTALEVSFLSSFTYLALQKYLKSRANSWLFELAPSLEAVRRTGMVGLWVGFGALTAGFLAGYLWARHSAGTGWRWDSTIILSTLTWASYLVALVFGLRSRFYGRWYTALNLGSFLFAVLTLLSTAYLSGLHRA